MFENMESLYNVRNGFTESLLQQKGTFFPAKEGVHSRNTFLRSLNGALWPRKKGTFLKVGGHMPPLPSPPVQFLGLLMLLNNYAI